MAIAEVPSIQDELERSALRGLWTVRMGVRDLPVETPVAMDGEGPCLWLRPLEDDGAPLTAERSGCGLVFDGTLFDEEELARRFPGEREGTADLVLRGYLEAGPDILRTLRGWYSLVLWDGRQRRLLAASDPLGMHPLQYADTDAGPILSASVEGLRADPRVDRTVAPTALVGFLWHRYPDMGETLYRSIRRIPPGHVLRIEGSTRSVERYWDPAPPDRPIEWITEDDLDRFDDLLDRAVARTLSMGPAGIYLSGGLDSVSVAAIAADHSGRTARSMPLALSLGFPHPECNEEEAQRRVAARLGLPQVLVPLHEAAGESLVDAALGMNATWPAPLLNYWLPGYRRLAYEAREQGCRVILTGSGGDEWLSVGPYHAADLLRRLDLAGFARMWAALQRSYPLSNAQMAENILWRFGLRPLLASAGSKAMTAVSPGRLRARRIRRNLSEMPPWLAPDPGLRRAAVEHSPLIGSLPPMTPHGYYVSEGRRALDHPIISMEMEENFELTRRLGLTEVYPYWDVDLVDFLFRTPPDLLIQRGRGKGLVRRMLSRRFPGLGVEQQRKIISTNFFRETILRDGLDIWQSVGGAEALGDLGIVDAAALDRSVRATVNGAVSAEAYRIWDVLSLETWVRNR
jgi:asparagine synthase (glutamine-hydrolysing)